MQVKKETVRNCIVDSAREQFYQYGYKNISVAKIAEKAETSVANIYNYFPNKEAILDEIVQNMTLKLDQLIEDNYRELLQSIEVEKIKEIYEMITSWHQNFNEEDAKSFLIMVNKCQDTKYVYYQQSMLEILRSYIKACLNEEVSDSVVKVISNMFMQKLIEGAESQCKSNQEESIENQETKTMRSKNWSLRVDEEKKELWITVYSLGKPSKESTKYFEEYYAVMGRDKGKEYTAIIDCRSIEDNKKVHLNQVVKSADFSSLKQVKVLLTKQQVALGGQFLRAFQDSTCSNCELVVTD